jgi:hypothetical protein
LSGSSPVSRFAQRKIQLAKVNLDGVFEKAIEYQKAPLEAFKNIKDRIDDVKSFFEPLKTIKTKADEYIWQVKKIVTYKNLSKLLKIAKPTEIYQNKIFIGYSQNQLEITLKNKMKLIFRRDFGPYAHELEKKYGYNGFIDHYNIEVHVPLPGRPGKNLKIYDDHIVPNASADEIRQLGGLIERKLKELI